MHSVMAGTSRPALLVRPAASAPAVPATPAPAQSAPDTTPCPRRVVPGKGHRHRDHQDAPGDQVQGIAQGEPRRVGWRMTCATPARDWARKPACGDDGGRGGGRVRGTAGRRPPSPRSAGTSAPIRTAPPRCPRAAARRCPRRRKAWCPSHWRAAAPRRARRRQQRLDPSRLRGVVRGPAPPAPAAPAALAVPVATPAASSAATTALAARSMRMRGGAGPVSSAPANGLTARPGAMAAKAIQPASEGELAPWPRRRPGQRGRTESRQRVQHDRQSRTGPSRQPRQPRRRQQRRHVRPTQARVGQGGGPEWGSLRAVPGSEYRPRGGRRRENSAGPRRGGRTPDHLSQP